MIKAIIIAAGQGTRLRPYTNKIPKSLLKIRNKSILERQIEIYKSLKIKDINIIVGYKKEKIKFNNINLINNIDYKNNNILESLFFAKKKMNSTCIISYSDIIFKKKIIKKLLKSKKNISILIDTNWKKNYKGRTMHPISQAENVYFDDNSNLIKSGKNLNLKESNGEFIGILKISNKGTKIFKKFYKAAKSKYSKKKFFNAKNIKKAYLTDFFNYLISKNININCTKIKNNWMEIDTIQDYKRAQYF